MHQRVVKLVIVLAALAACSGSTDTAAPAAGQESSQVPVENNSIDESVPAATSTPPPATDATSTTEPAPTTTVAAPPTTMPRETRTLAVVDPETGEVMAADVEFGGPTTFDEVLDAGIEAGLWDESEGVIRVLDNIVGVLPAEQVPGVDEVLTGEFSEILFRAQAIISDGTASAEQLAVLKQRVSLISPPQATLDEIAAQPNVVRTGFAPRLLAQVGCAPVDPNDWDDDAWIDGCYQVVQRDIGDATLRVFYPTWYDDDVDLANLPLITLEALNLSIETYRELGRIGNIDVVFSAVDTVENEDALASALPSTTNDVVDGCRVSLFPIASADGIAAFEQTVAHEAWHCVQYSEGMKSTDGEWFVEGGAEFFSNVVYPTTNDEHGWIETFDGQIRTPIDQMSYEAWIWWQHVSNETSPSTVAELHRQMYGGGGVEVLAGYEVIFHDFVADFVAGVIVDQGGGALPAAENSIDFPPVVEGDEGRELGGIFQAWAPLRLRIPYGKELRVLQTDASDGGIRSMVRWEDRSNRGEWQGVFPEVRSTCTKPADFAAVVTDATSDASSAFEFKIVVDSVEKAECDPCLFGTWSLDLDTFEALILQAAASEGGLPPGASFSFGGAYYFSFDEESVAREQRDDFTISVSLAGLGSVDSTVNAFATGTYFADGENFALMDMVESFNEVTVNSPIGPAAFSFPGAIDSSGGTYTCDEDKLVLTTGSYPPVSWTRVDRILSPPEAVTDPETGTPSED